MRVVLEIFTFLTKDDAKKWCSLKKFRLSKQGQQYRTEVVKIRESGSRIVLFLDLETEQVVPTYYKDLLWAKFYVLWVCKEFIIIA